MEIWGFNVSPKTGFVSAIDDRLGGKTYRRFHKQQRIGDVFKYPLHHSKTISLTDTNQSFVHVRIIATVHHNTVRALLRKSSYSEQRLDRGHWYEVMSD